jgi:Uma2 family endonuclease
MTRLGGDLGSFDDDWIVLVEPELRLGPRPDVVVPDLTGWHKDRLAEEPEEAFIRIPPDWVCEILSDSTEAMDRGPKRRIYRREGVGHLWLCDPRIQTLEVYRLEGGRWSEIDTLEGDTKVRAEPFEAIELDLARAWRW